jgi:nickel superoxide dismutase
MAAVDRLISLVDRVDAPNAVEAHCDIPCGIYDPHAAQIAALTVIRMLQLIENNQMAGQDKAAMDAYGNSISRYIAVKEEHAALAEREIVILWTDYFRPEHLDAVPNLHDLVWKTCKLTSVVKQQLNMQAAQDLLAGTQQIAEAFWKTKNIPTKRVPSNQPAGGELVVPAN